MVKMFECTISALHIKDNTADIAIPERENSVKTDVPFLSGIGDYPNVNDTVLALIEENRGRLEKGYIIGKLM